MESNLKVRAKSVIKLQTETVNYDMEYTAKASVSGILENLALMLLINDSNGESLLNSAVSSAKLRYDMIKSEQRIQANQDDKTT